MAAAKQKPAGKADNADASDPLMVMSVEKAFRVLEALDDQRPSMTLTQIAEAIDLDKSAAQRFVHTLTKLGYLHKDPETKRFRLSVKALSLGHYYMRANRLISRTAPYLLHLSNTTGERVNLSVLHESEIVLVSRFVSRDVLNPDIMIGTRFPAYCTASGRAILSRLPAAEARDVLKRSDLKPYTDQTAYRIPDVMARLETAARQGYASVYGEFFPGDLSVAAPILDANGRSLGAINISTARPGFDPPKMEQEFVPLVLAAARSVSERTQP
jgi:IclR family transcriptional regulator, pca regulon regulatory protein